MSDDRGAFGFGAAALPGNAETRRISGWELLMEKTVYDVGMHQGEDTEFYLSRGCRVIGVEANPQLVAALREKFANEIATGQLSIVDRAIAPEPGKITFAINRNGSVWGTVSQEFIKRAVHSGDELEFVEIEALPFRDILGRYGVPYYLKVDIEGMDMECVGALYEFAERPKFISIETAATANIATVEAGFAELSALWSLGYRRFKYVDQAALPKLDGRTLDAEGSAVRYRYRSHSSGPFGDETPGDWLTVDRALRQMQRLVRFQNKLGFGGKRQRSLFWRSARRLRRYVKRLPVNSWYDLHARMGEEGEPPRGYGR
jgi:FkbM family methyltransferase